MRAATKTTCLVLVLTIGLSLIAQVALAQANAGSKASGQYNFYGSSAHSSFHSAPPERRSLQPVSQQRAGDGGPAGCRFADSRSECRDRGVAGRRGGSRSGRGGERYDRKLHRKIGPLSRQDAKACRSDQRHRVARTHRRRRTEHRRGEDSPRSPGLAPLGREDRREDAQQHCDKINAR